MATEERRRQTARVREYLYPLSRSSAADPELLPEKTYSPVLAAAGVFLRGHMHPV